MKFIERISPATLDELLALTMGDDPFPRRMRLGAKVYAEGPSGAPELGIRFVVTPLFPTGGK